MDRLRTVTRLQVVRVANLDRFRTVTHLQVLKVALSVRRVVLSELTHCLNGLSVVNY